MKKVLVIMPVYNEERLLKRAIYSILEQTHTNFKLIIINDGSTDNTLKEAKKFLYDKRVEVIDNKENLGCYYSRNLGIKYLESEEYDYYTVHDADDFSQPTRFEENINAFNQDQKIISVYNYSFRIGKDSPEWHNAPFEPVPDLAHAFFQKKVFKFLGYFDNMEFNADQEYWERLRAFCHNNENYIYFINKVLYYAEVTEKNMIIKYNNEIRNMYREKFRYEIKNMEIKNNFYRNFFNINEILRWKI